MGGAGIVYSASIPATLFADGDIVRWFVSCSDQAGAVARDPAFTAADEPEFYGTMVGGSAKEAFVSDFHWYTPDAVASTSVEGLQVRSVANVFTTVAP